MREGMTIMKFIIKSHRHAEVILESDSQFTSDWEQVKIALGSIYDGDIITYREAIHAMLLPSSNTCAEATATAVGHKILQYANK